MMNKGTLFIISGPSGSGKDTLLSKIFEKQHDIFFSISSITRKMREGETEGKKYHFITKDEFLDLLKKDAFLEYNEYVGNYYGTPKAPVMDAINSGKDVIVEVDVNGAAEIRKKIENTKSIFIMPPSYNVLKQRLKGRGTDSDEVIAVRLKEALNEIKRAYEYTYVVKNDSIDNAVDDVLHILLSERSKTERQKNLIDEVLKLC